MYIRLLVGIGRDPQRNGLTKGSVHDWNRTVTRRFEEQWGPMEEWGEILTNVIGERALDIQDEKVQTRQAKMKQPKQRKEKAVA